MMTIGLKWRRLKPAWQPRKPQSKTIAVRSSCNRPRLKGHAPELDKHGPRSPRQKQVLRPLRLSSTVLCPSANAKKPSLQVVPQLDRKSSRPLLKKNVRGHNWSAAKLE